jgi:steroid 5-alpha reductase family enzyme
MSAHEKKSWIDTWWPLLVILFGVTFISTLVFFHPHF